VPESSSAAAAAQVGSPSSAAALQSRLVALADLIQIRNPR
jgi:hypothetical protein